MADSAALKHVGLKATLPRLKILEFLENSEKRHVSAEDVYKALLISGEEIGLATIYRVLTQFEAAGMVIRHHFEGERSVFELAQDVEHHDHLVCVKCGDVTEFVCEEIEQLQREAAADHGYMITDHSLCIYGLCRDCQ